AEGSTWARETAGCVNCCSCGRFVAPIAPAYRGSNSRLSARLSGAPSGTGGAQRGAVERADQVAQLARLGERARESRGELGREGADPSRRHESQRQDDGERGVERRRVSRLAPLEPVQIGEHERRRRGVEEPLRGGIGEGGARECQRAQDTGRGGGEEKAAGDLERGCTREDERSARAAHG